MVRILKKTVQRCVLAISLGLFFLKFSDAADSPGTTAANFLKIPVSPRSIAMGELGVTLAEDSFVQNVNPASLAFLQYQQMGLMHNQWIEDISQQYLSWVYPARGPGTYGASVNLLSISDIQGYDANGAAADSVAAQDLAVAVSYARPLRGRVDADQGQGVSWGVTAKYIRQQLETDVVMTPAFDFGILSQWPGQQILWRTGVSVRNLGSSVSFDENENPLPSELSVGVGAITRWPWGDLMTLGVEANQYVDQDLLMSLGGEYWVNEALALRLGWRLGSDLGDGIRMGFGVKVKIVKFDYALASMGAFGLTHRVGFTLNFGEPVSITPAPKAEELQCQRLLKKAHYLMKNGRYLEATMEVDRCLEAEPSNEEAMVFLERLELLMHEKEMQ